MPYTFIGAIGNCEMGNKSVTNNPVAILTQDNIICFTSDVLAIEYAAGDTLFTLPSEDFYPKSTVFVPVVVTFESGVKVTYLKINSAGEASMEVALENATIHLGSVAISINDKYYNKEIGNISGFTRPLNRR